MKFLNQLRKLRRKKNGMKINFATQRFEKYVELLVLQQNREKRWWIQCIVFEDVRKRFNRHLSLFGVFVASIKPRIWPLKSISP